jgi:putative transposase
VYACLLDEGRYVCSVRTMYRILAEHDEVRERRDQLRHPNYQKPELLATGPNQVWSWDITKLLGPVKWSYFYLYNVLDIYSRYTVGWMIAMQESGHLAEALIAEICERQGIAPRSTHLARRPGQADAVQATGLFAGRSGRDQEPFPALHFQRQSLLRGAVQNHEVPPGLPAPVRQLAGGAPMGSGVSSTGTITSIITALGLLTPADVHFGRAAEVLQQRQIVLQQAYDAILSASSAACPNLPLPEAVWINPPQEVKR